MTGRLQDMIIFGTEANAIPRTLSLIHESRVLIIVIPAPLFLTVCYDTLRTNPIVEPTRNLPLHELALMVLAAFVSCKADSGSGLFGALILGPLNLTATLPLGHFIDARTPREAILAAQFFFGCGIGVKFVGVTWVGLRRLLAAGVAYVLVFAIQATAFTAVVTTLGLGQPVEANWLLRPADRQI
ncbi:AbrB family transcriptional regulator [Ruegeria sp. Ofav3-42]|uniref:AbrB family transcriptional regulator n=1 Tax=Ruegeria sp. Ofav3-42 TaxID=2917759 RepID=UPI002107DA9A|nr:AbrB family transcriptional regulator [Ruegeria sp. Ofav3-42]